jgi:galactokinase
MTGGGFGGCTVTLAKTDRAAAIADEITAAYERETGIRATTLTSRPSRGAHVISAS